MTSDEKMGADPPLPPIHVVRDESVVLDSDLALAYGVETRVFNQAFSRNRDRFPSDFAYQLQPSEWDSLRSQIVTLKAGRGRHRKYLPWVFTEHGALMAGSILNSEQAVAMSVYVVRAFVKMRRELLTNSTLEARLGKIDETLFKHDEALRDLYARLRPLILQPPAPPKRRIGFHNQPNSDP